MQAMQLTLAKTEHTPIELNCSPDHIAVFAAQIAAASRLSSIPVSDWPTRAATALVTNDPSVAVVVSIVHRSDRCVERTGSAGPMCLPDAFARLLADEVPRCTPQGPIADHGARQIAWTEESAHPFAATGLPQGCVAASTTTVSAAFVLVVWVWQSFDAPSAINLGLLDAATDFVGSLAGGLCMSARSTIDWLSPSETAVLDLIVVGHTVPEIGQAISRSANTVHDHLKSIHRKAHVHSRGELVSAALGQRPPAR